MPAILRLPVLLLSSKYAININLNGNYRYYSHIFDTFNSRRVKSFTVDALAKCHYNGIISESKIREMLQNRKFITVNHPSPSENFLNFTVCSYNILAQYQLNNNIYLYTHCDSGVLEWPMRWNNIRNDLERMNCDVYCLQEVQCEHYHADIEPAMTKMGYRGFLSPKTGKKQDGCAMFVKTSVFDCAQSTIDTVTFHRPGIATLSTDNVGQVALLTPVGHPLSKLCVSNTHLFFNPNRGEIKLAEIILLLSEIDIRSDSNRSANRDHAAFYWPIVFCGDLNSEPVSAIYQFLANGRCDIDGILASEVSAQNATSFLGAKSAKVLSRDELPPRIGIGDDMVADTARRDIDQQPLLGSGRLSHQLKLKSAYRYSCREKKRLVTAFTNADTCAVDFIFYRDTAMGADEGPQGGNARVPPYLQLVSYLELLSSDEFFSFGGIPNRQHGSDHIPLVANFNLHV